MADTVSFWNVVGKTRLLLAVRSRYFGLYVLASLVLYSAPYLITGVDPFAEESPEKLWLPFLVNMTLLPALSLSLQHFSIESCRNNTSFFPPKPLLSFLRYMLLSIALVFFSGICLIVASIPMFGIWGWGGVDNPETAIYVTVLMYFFGLIAAVVATIPFMRFGPVLPATTVGDECSFSRAWRMTKGHTLKLLVAASLLYIPSLVVGFVGGLFMADGIGWTFALILYLIDSIAMVVGLAFFSILYEELRLRYDALTANAAAV